MPNNAYLKVKPIVILKYRINNVTNLKNYNYSFKLYLIVWDTVVVINNSKNGLRHWISGRTPGQSVSYHSTLDQYIYLKK